MKKAVLGTIFCGVVVGVLAVGASIAAANDHKHGFNGHPYAPSPVYSHHGYTGNYHDNHYGHHGYRPGHWSGGRWIAPVAIAATIGALAYGANSYYYSPATAYVAPSYYAPVRYVSAPAYDRFSELDRNADGYISYHEARGSVNLQRDFGRIDSNRDGYLSRDEVDAYYGR